MPDSKPLIDHPPVRLRRCRHGPMLYLTTDLYIGRSLDLYGEFSRGETVLLHQLVRPGETVLEIGANIGAHTVPLAQAVGPEGIVHAFEPQRLIFQLLDANVALNALVNVHTHRVVVGQQAGTARVPVLDPRQSLNFGGLALPGQTEGESLPVIALDDLALESCHLLKIDVEGMENEVIAGAEGTLSRFRPRLYVENDREERSAELIERLFELGYRLYWHLPPLFDPDNFRGHESNVFGALVSVNMLGIHRSTPSVVDGLREVTSPRDRWTS